MPAYDLHDRLVVGVASSALFDLTESDAYFRAHGQAAYAEYQERHIDDLLEPGPAMPFIARLLQLNDLRPGDPVVEVIVLSRNDATTGLRVMRSIERYGLSVTRAFFTQGGSPLDYIPALGMSLFLTQNRDDVLAAVRAGSPAGHVLPSTAAYELDDKGLRIAFDFDAVLATDESERVFQSAGIERFVEHEVAKRDVAHAPGLLKPLVSDLNRIQQLEKDRQREDPSYEPRVRIALVTARAAPAHERAVNSLKEWGITVNDAFFLGGIEKAKVLEVMRPHLFFDDQHGHLSGALEHVAGVHVPYGVANETLF
ncbi:5'-nucleotidase [Demequina zhanjiangensis]|uniref:5'-nucleotidase n=1 Tax=Demequina zhanjiangensis TaxID=3051659 RepID=A0ABT8G2T6_9MICO|nr:5'-nucleotidase [Demequina sp. SYSU T00b26]MDN4473445.1 5'-nucleotidase [Demequina sp. SYSU T00b26]